MAYTITTFSGAKRVSYESLTVTGSCVDHATGLNTVENVQLTVKDATQANNAAGYMTCNFAGNTGNVSYYAWADDGTVATNNATALAMVIGT